MQDQAPRVRSSRSSRSTKLLIGLAAVLGVQCTALAVVAIAHQSPFSEYLGWARRCVELDDCPSRGGRTGGLPLYHGASWIRLLVLSLRSGHDLTLVQSIVLSGWLASLPFAFFLLHRYLGLRAAVLGLGLYFPVILVGTDASMLTYTNLLPLPLVIYYGSVALFLERRSGTFAAIASVALAAAISAELGSIIMLPFHFTLVAVLARRRLLMLTICVLSFAIPFYLDSFDALREIIRQVPTLRFAVALAVCAVAVGIAVRVGWRMLASMALSLHDQLRALMAAALVYATGTIWAGNLVLLRNVPAPRYFLPASVPFLFLVADRTRRLSDRQASLMSGLELVMLMLLLLLGAPRGLGFLQVPVTAVVSLYALAVLLRPRLWSAAPPPARWPAVAICACAIAVSGADALMAIKRGPSQALSLADAERLIARLYGAGYRYPQLLAALQGPAVDDMMALLTERDPDLFTALPAPLAEPDDSLLVLKVDADAVPRTEGVMAAVPTDRSRALIVVRGRPFLDWNSVRRCTPGEDGDARLICAQPLTNEPLPRNWPFVRFGLAAAAPPSAIEGTRRGSYVRFNVPVHTPGQGVAHLIRTGNEWPSTWQIMGVSGVPYEGSLPTKEIRLPDTAPADGWITLEFDSPMGGDLPWVWMPHVAEVSAPNAHLLDALRTGR